MTEMTDLPELMVGDAFWLRRAQTMVEGAVDRRDAAAIRLSAAVAWFWSVYAGAAVVGSALAHRRYSSLEAAGMSSPAVLLILAYGVALWATLPIEVAFDPRSPLEIEAAHERVARTKLVRLRVALLLTLLASVGVAVAVVVVATAGTGPK